MERIFKAVQRRGGATQAPESRTISNRLFVCKSIMLGMESTPDLESPLEVLAS